MNPAPRNPSLPEAASPSTSGEQTLRLIAGLPAPAGLEGRVHEALGAAPPKGRILAWPKISLESNWLRTAAAAAIVCVVVGGGWGVYAGVQHSQPAGMVAAPPRVPASAGFSNAGAIRTPQTLPGPVLTLPAAPEPARPEAGLKPENKPVSHRAKTGQPAAAAHPAVEPEASR
jgi:hypothetical protein